MSEQKSIEWLRAMGCSITKDSEGYKIVGKVTDSKGNISQLDVRVGLKSMYSNRFPGFHLKIVKGKLTVAVYQ